MNHLCDFGRAAAASCIARALAVSPEVLLLDEALFRAPIPSLPPRLKIFLVGLKQQCTASSSSRTTYSRPRASANTTGFFLLGKLIEHDKTDVIFTNPSRRETEDYITGRFRV